MSDKLFVIAIGGTGMRCLESFVHLCAIGMFDNQEIEAMVLDTDSNNGNLGRTGILIGLYNQIKSVNQQNIDGGRPNADTFFSAKINFYKFTTDYNQTPRSNFRNIAGLKGSSLGEEDDNQALADLFLDKNSVQEFNLAHGYRAQTHLGSLLMYHGIIEAARKIRDVKPEELSKAEKDLSKFLEKLTLSAESARVFVFGSVFGGTGASSIPIIPTAFKDAVSILSNNKQTLDLSRTKFGSTLLTEYFSFKRPNSEQMKVEKGVVADSSFFPLNSQAALQFYQNDPTVQKTYKRLYHVGWPLESKSLSKASDTQNITGGQEQKNDCHFVELMCACAAYDFFTLDDTQLTGTKAQYLFRILECTNDTCFDVTSGNDLVGERGEIFTNKLAAFLSFAHLDLKAGTKAFLNTLKDKKITEYDNIAPDDQTCIEDYMKLFDYSVQDGKFIPGWICQIKNSLGSGAFILNPKAFPGMGQKGNIDFQEGIDKLIADERHHWDLSKGAGAFGMGKDPLNTLVYHMLNPENKPKQEQKVNTVKETFLAHIYNAITVAQNFNEKKA